MTFAKETRMKFMVVGLDNCAPDLTPIQGYFDDDEMKSCPRCDRRFEDHDEVRLTSYPTMSFGWYEQRLEHVNCAQTRHVGCILAEAKP